MATETCPKCGETAEKCAESGCGYGACDTCGEEWDLDMEGTCPDYSEDEDGEPTEDACQGEWVHWTDA